MRVLLVEYATGGGLVGGPAEDGLLAEGMAMLTALLADFAAVEGCELVTFADRRLGSAAMGRLQAEAPRARVEAVEPGGLTAAVETWVEWADAALIVAPESGGVLASLTAVVEGAGKQNLGSSSRGVRLAGDKLLCAERLQAAGIPVPPFRPVAPGDSLPPEGWPLPVVVKPRDGCGAEEVRVLRRPAEWGGGAGHMVQAHVPGVHASASLLVSGGRAVGLSLNGQRMHLEGDRYRYEGGRVPLLHPLGGRALAVACAAAEAIPGLGGYVGVDLVLADREAYVIEVNPRVTTAYVGLRRVYPANLAAAILDAARGRLPQAPGLLGSVAFRKDGTLLEGVALWTQ